MYSILFTPTSKRAFLKLEKTVQTRIAAVLGRVCIRPEHFFKRLVGVKSYSLRVGDYRVIADIQHNQLIILVIQIAHRKKVYNKP
ncbi:MAG: type II toxin-antitoxin system RelE/ParE family toxin [Candidatus Diapherotrites archaeon]|nr:type II toxin-antitoxin system RelE/ParE family toxin [Candidatus Diapherotrites archaeon]